MNAVYILVETIVKENYAVEDSYEVIAYLQNLMIDEDGLLRIVFLNALIPL